MKRLVVYDAEGFILSSIGSTNDLREPVGVPYMVIELPDNKQVTSVDVTVTPHKPILVDMPKSETQLLQEQLDAQSQAIAELSLLVGGGM